jgi:hypothetical protein
VRKGVLIIAGVVVPILIVVAFLNLHGKSEYVELKTYSQNKYINDSDFIIQLKNRIKGEGIVVVYRGRDENMQPILQASIYEQGRDSGTEFYIPNGSEMDFLNGPYLLVKGNLKDGMTDDKPVLEITNYQKYELPEGGNIECSQFVKTPLAITDVDSGIRITRADIVSISAGFLKSTNIWNVDYTGYKKLIFVDFPEKTGYLLCLYDTNAKSVEFVQLYKEVGYDLAPNVD